MTVLRSIDSFQRVTPLGVRFVDDQGGRVVADGMLVTSWPTREPGRRRRMPCNGGNAYYLLDAPGLRDLEFGAGDDAYWSALPRHIGFTVEVEDLLNRFLPFRFQVELPHRGLLRLRCGSPLVPLPLPEGAPVDGVPLFTAPARAPTPGTVVIRADLWDATAERPAAWARLEARTPGARLRGEPPWQALADHRGRVALHFPIPDESDFDGGGFDSPLGGGSGALSDRTWSVELTAFYGRLLPAAATERRIAPPVPSLCAALAQPPAKLWDRLGGAPVALTETSLRMGQTHLLRSTDVGTAPASVVLLT